MTISKLKSDAEQALLQEEQEKQLRECDDVYKNIERFIKSQPSYGVELQVLKKAYDKARELHGKTLRESGDLYLSHPLAAMESLAKMRCNTSILAAALLHDTLEDCEYNPKDLRVEFGPKIEAIVSAVTAIKEAEDSIQVDLSTLTKQEKHDILDQLTDAKLINSKYQREAFLVRLADREHNLSTIMACRPEKRRQKIERTQAFLIPAAERLGMRYFEVSLKDYCLMYREDSVESKMIRDSRNECLMVNGPIYSEFDAALQKGINSQSYFMFPPYNPFARIRGSKHGKKDDPKIEKRRMLKPYEILSQLKDNLKFTKSELCLTEVLLTTPERDKTTILSRFISFYKEHLRPSHFFFDIISEDDDCVVVRISDIYDNNFRIVIVPEDRLENYFIGNPSGERLTTPSERSLGDAIRPKITVYAYSPYKGLRKFDNLVPRGATALDFAFLVSEPLALTVKTAHIHRYTGERPVFAEDDYPYHLKTILNDGDVVYFDADYEPKLKQYKNNAKIEWFGYINTEYARNCLIEYFNQFVLE